MTIETMRRAAVRTSIACALYFLMTNAFVPARAASEDAAPTDESATVEPTVSHSPIQLLHLEIEGILQAGQERLAGLNAELEATADPSARIEVHRKIERAKVLTEIELFQAQLGFAQSTGRIEMAETLRATIENLAARNGIELEEDSPAPVER